MQDLVDNRYSIQEPLGSGGMARVYLAHDEVLGRDVALKVLDRRHADDEEFAERFRREARSAAALGHPRIVSVYDRGETEEGAPYISMEYVPRGTLEERIQREGRLGADAAAGVAAQISEALEVAHERGVIHRDIKPHNILVTDSGDVKVADFGIARALSSTTITGGFILGTAAYMSPEQAQGEQVDARSDLYALGVVLYEMLTGALPFEAEGRVAAALKHLDEPPPHPKELVPSVPDALDTLVVRLLAKDPADRPRSATDVLGELRRAGSESRSAAPKEPRQSEPRERTPPTEVAPETPRGGARGRAPRRSSRRTPRRMPQPGSLIPWALVVLFIVILALVIRYVLSLPGSPPIP